MAWITKDSANARIERRDEPYLTDAMQTEIRDRYLPRFETRMGALLPCLHLIQDAYGWIPHQAMVEIARFLEITPAEVIDTATFYEEYWLRPKGRTVVAVCRSIACEFCGQPEITDTVRDALGIEVGETTEDDAFTLIELECIGSCGTAPAILIGHTLHENVTPEQIPQLLQAARTAEAH